MIAPPRHPHDFADITARMVCEKTAEAMRGEIANAEDRYWALQNGYRLVGCLDCDRTSFLPRYYPDFVVERYIAAMPHSLDSIKSALTAALSDGPKPEHYQSVLASFEALAKSLRRDSHAQGDVTK